MNIPLDCCLFYSGNLPEGIEAWCKHRGIKAKVFALVDGGGDCGFAVGFPNEAMCSMAAKDFPPRAQNYPMGEILSLVAEIGG
jgi:hypothetical protein